MFDDQLIVIGCGVLGKQIFQKWNGSFLGIVKSHDSMMTLSAEGINSSIQMPTQLESTSVIFSTNGSQNQLDAINNFVSLNPNFSGKAILISSTSYYQGTHGPVDEESEGGSTGRSLACQQVENCFRDSFIKGWVLRCGGLFEPGRGPYAYLSRTKQIPPISTGQQLALFSYRDLARLVDVLLKEEVQNISIFLCTVAKCPTRYEYYAAAFNKLKIPLKLTKDPLSGPMYNSAKLLNVFRPIDYDWNAALC